MINSDVSYIVYCSQEMFSIATKTSNLPFFGINGVINTHKTGNEADSFHIRRIIAWDVRNEGDIDYGVQSSDHQEFGQEEVIDWLAHITQLVRDNDSNHLITAGWWGDPLVTSPYVDFLSFHQFDSFNVRQLQDRIEQYQQSSTQPLLLQEVGYHSWIDAPDGARDEQTQAEILGDVVNAVEETKIAGWVVWTAFDFILAPGQSPNYEHFFGLWRTDLTPKPALQSILEH